MKRLCLCFLLFALFEPTQLFSQGYRLEQPIQLGGSGAWDYLKADSAERRLYVSHSGEVIVLNLDTHAQIGVLTDFGFIHGIVIVNSLNTGFLSDGQKNEVVTFDPGTLQIKGRIKTAANPNSMAYDAGTRRLFVGHKPSKSTTVINAATGAVESRIELGGIPEFPVADGKGNLYVNIEDRNEIVRVDTKTLKVIAHYPLAPCEAPSGLAFDAVKRRLFAACDNRLMAVVNADTGAVVTTVPIGDGPDAAGFDPGTHLAFSSNGGGTLTVVEDQGGDRYQVTQNVSTQAGARTMALDEKTHTVFLSAAKLGPPPTPTPQNPHPPNHPTAVAGTFKLLVVQPHAPN